MSRVTELRPTGTQVTTAVATTALAACGYWIVVGHAPSAVWVAVWVVAALGGTMLGRRRPKDQESRPEPRTRLVLDDRWHPTGERWVRHSYQFSDPGGVAAPEIWHLDGVPWHEAPVPSVAHLCTAQTYGIVNHFTQYERCACGATRRNARGWFERNTRKAS